jgi:hypothetical protein
MSTPVELAADYLEVARQYAANPDEWPMAPRFDPTNRWYSRLEALDGYEVWLLSWLPGQGTDWHDHGGSSGGFVVVSGEIIEHTAHSGQPGAPTRYRQGEGRRFGTDHVHRITNVSPRPAVSVHAYGPALQTMTRYRLEANRLRIEAVDRAGAQW